MSLALLLPGVRLDYIGVNLEDFFRQLLLAAKAAHPGNLRYPLYPLSEGDDDFRMALPSNTQIARYTESRLARFVVLRQEGNLIRLYRQITRDAMRSVFPRRWARVDFHQRYLAGAELPALALAFDALFWFLVRRTTRTLSVSDGLRLIHSFFLDEDAWSTGERIQSVREKHADLVDASIWAYEVNLVLATAPFDAGKTYMVVNREHAPVEGMNSYAVQFDLAVPCAILTTFLPAHEYALVEKLESYREQVGNDLRAGFAQRFGCCLRERGVRTGVSSHQQARAGGGA